jgi:DNA polymerase
MTEDTPVPLDESATHFELDDRQRAMLAEMGVRVWMPQTASALPAMASKLVQVAAPLATPVANTPQLLSVPIVDISNLPEGIASMNWAQLQPAVAACSGCGLSQSRQQAILGEGLTSADWMIVGDAPGEEEDKTGRSFAGPAGQ